MNIYLYILISLYFCVNSFIAGNFWEDEYHRIAFNKKEKIVTLILDLLFGILMYACIIVKTAFEMIIKK